MKLTPKRKTRVFLIVNVFLMFALFLPAIHVAQASLVPCDGVSTPCNFNTFLTLVNSVIKFVLKDLVLPISAILFVYVGFLLITSGGESSKKTEAKNIFWNLVIGLIITAAAWLIIDLILYLLGYNGAWIGFK
jgi:hypothetical protein